MPSLLAENGSNFAGLGSAEEHTALLRAHAAWEEDSTQNGTEMTEKGRKSQTKKWVTSKEAQE